MLNDVFKNAQHKMDQTVEHMRNELKALRTGRANLGLLESVRVDYYGTPSPLNQVCTLAVADPTLITATPWEASMIKEIEKAIMASGLGLTPGNDGKMVRIPIPALTEERRKELVKKAKECLETAKVALRQVRHEARDGAEKLEKDKAISEDEKKRAFDHIQQVVEKHTKELEEMLKRKEAEIMEV